MLFSPNVAQSHSDGPDLLGGGCGYEEQSGGFLGKVPELVLKDDKELARGREEPLCQGTLFSARVKAQSLESTRQDLRSDVCEAEGGMRGDWGGK